MAAAPPDPTLLFEIRTAQAKDIDLSEEKTALVLAIAATAAAALGVGAIVHAAFGCPRYPSLRLRALRLALFLMVLRYVGWWSVTGVLGLAYATNVLKGPVALRAVLAAGSAPWGPERAVATGGLVLAVVALAVIRVGKHEFWRT